MKSRLQHRRQAWMRALCAGSLLVLLCGTTTTAEITSSTNRLPRPVPVTETRPKRAVCAPIDFETAVIERRGTVLVALISGNAAYAPEQIQLLPVMYVMMPDYWQIKLIGCRPSGARALPVAKPYRIERALDGSIGHKGIRLMGLTRQLRLDLPP